MNPQTTKHDETIFRKVLILGMILFATVLRIVPHPWNLTPVGAMALFSGAMVRKVFMAFPFALMALLAGDLMVGLHILMPVVYASFLISTALGFSLRKCRRGARLGGVVLLGAMP